MNANEIKLDIEKRISEIDQSFTNHWQKSISKKLLEDDVVSLKKLLLIVSNAYRIYKIISIVVSTFLWVLLTFLWVLSTIKYYEGIDIVDMNKYGFFLNINTYVVVIIVGLPTIIVALKYSRIKVNLENKIYLLTLLDKILNEKTRS